MDDINDARSIAEKLTGKSRPSDDKISATTKRLYKRGRDQFRDLVLAEVERLHNNNYVVGVETWKRGLEIEKRKEFEATKRALYRDMQKELYENAVKEEISPEELACITLQERDKNVLKWNGDTQMTAVRLFVIETIEKMWGHGEPIPEAVLDWVGVFDNSSEESESESSSSSEEKRVQPARKAKKRKTK
jgi:hypothetical protein